MAVSLEIMVVALVVVDADRQVHHLANQAAIIWEVFSVIAAELCKKPNQGAM